MVKAVDQGKEEMRFSMLWLVSYCFLLRLPSEVRLGSCCLLGTLVVCCCFARRSLCANASQTRRSLRHPSPLFGGRATRSACACCVGRTGSQAAASSFELAVMRSVSVCPGSGSGVMRRKCSCCGAARSATCAVHTLWDRFIAPLTDGEVPWGNVSPTFARSRLR